MADNANVRIVIDAITEAAEQALNQVGDEISGMGRDARVGQAALDEVGDELNNAAADAGVFQAAANRAKAETRDLATSLGIMQNRADEAGDEIAGAGGKAIATSGAFTSLTLSTDGAALSFGSLSTSITAALIPALIALSTTIAPLVATLTTAAAAATGLAGAFGLIIGSGILAYGSELSKQNEERLRQINSEIKALEELRKAQGSLTDEQKEKKRQAEATIKRLQKWKKLNGELKDGEKKRLKEAQKTLEQLEKRRQATGELTAAQKERLQQLKEEKKEVKEQTSITGALGAELGKLKEELVPIIAEFGKNFIPLVKDAIGALPTLVQNVLDAVGGMDEFKSALRDFGSGAMDAIPDIVSTLVDLGSEALPVVRDLIGFLMDDGADAFSEMVSTTKDLGPTFSEFFGAMVDAAPAINDFGTNLLQRLLPALGDLVKSAAELMSRVDWDMVDGAFQRLSEAGGELAPTFSKLAEELVELSIGLGPIVADLLPTLVKVLKFVAWAVGVVAEAWNSLSLTQQKAVLVALAAVIGALGGPLTALAAAIVIVGIAFDDMKALAKGAMDWLDKKLDSAADWVGAFVSDAQTFLTNLPGQFLVALSKVNGVVKAEGNKVYNFFAGLWNDLLSQATMGLEGLANKFVTGLNKLISRINGLIRTANKKVPGFQMGELGSLGKVQMDSSSLEMERRSTDANALARQSAQQVGVQIGFDTRGEGPLADFVDQRAEAKVQQGHRQDTRRLRRQNATQG